MYIGKTYNVNKKRQYIEKEIEYYEYARKMLYFHLFTFGYIKKRLLVLYIGKTFDEKRLCRFRWLLV